MLAGSITFQFGKNKNLKTKKLAAKYIAIFSGLPVRKKNSGTQESILYYYIYIIYMQDNRAHPK